MKIALARIARKLRSQTTDAESRLWHALRNCQLNGFKFKRQAPFGPYIADFICIEARLIVEADGGQHAEQGEADEARTKYFEEGGYRVVRFWNNEVLVNLDGVLETVASELATKTPSPQPSPSKPALASLQHQVTASASGCGWEREFAAAPLLEGEGISSVPSPIRIRLRMRILERQARQGELAGRRTG